MKLQVKEGYSVRTIQSRSSGRWKKSHIFRAGGKNSLCMAVRNHRGEIRARNHSFPWDEDVVGGGGCANCKWLADRDGLWRPCETCGDKRWVPGCTGPSPVRYACPECTAPEELE